jgi:hypothetical protein
VEGSVLLPLTHEHTCLRHSDKNTKTYTYKREYNPYRTLTKHPARHARCFFFFSTSARKAMRAQLRTASNDRALAMCPTVHNISGQLIMDRPINPSFINASGMVCHKKNFGNTRCLYSVTGNVLFRPGKIDMVFKGVRSAAAMCQTLNRATGGELVNIRVSMLVMTIQLQKTFSVCEQCPLELAIIRLCGNAAVQMLPRTEEESNSLIFRISKWAIFLPGEPEITASMDNMNSIVSMSRLGNCTLRTSSSVRGSLQTWLETQKGVHYALNRFAHVILSLDLKQ